MNSYAERYFDEIRSVSASIDLAAATVAAEMLLNIWQEGGRIYVAGNGGSAATASHFVCDLSKLTIAEGMPRIRASSLSDNVPLLTAWSNDSNYADAFVHQVEDLLRPHDLIFCISGSGNSPNVLQLASYARSHEIRSIGLTGFSGGKLKSLVDLAVVIPSMNMQIIEDLHLATCHMISAFLRDTIRDTVATNTVVAASESSGPEDICRA